MPRRTATLSPIGRLVKRQRAAALAALQAANPPPTSGEGVEAASTPLAPPQPDAGVPATQISEPTIVAAKISVATQPEPARPMRKDPGPKSAHAQIAESQPEPGTWRLVELGPSQCRFACTPHAARPEAHRFCGQPTRVGPGNLHGSWCPEHLPLVWSGAKTAGGRSMADAERERGVA